MNEDTKTNDQARDAFAAAALPVVLSHDFDDNPTAVCERVWHVANAMMRERERSRPQEQKKDKAS